MRGLLEAHVAPALRESRATVIEVTIRPLLFAIAP